MSKSPSDSQGRVESDDVKVSEYEDDEKIHDFIDEEDLPTINLFNGSVNDYSDRKLDYKLEQGWLAHNPNTEAWEKLYNDYKRSIESKTVDRDLQTLSRFTYLARQKENRSNILAITKKGGVIESLAMEILSEVLEIRLLEIASQYFTLSKVIRQSLEDTIVKSVRSATSGSQSSNSKNLGHSLLCRGFIREMLRRSTVPASYSNVKSTPINSNNSKNSKNCDREVNLVLPYSPEENDKRLETYQRTWDQISFENVTLTGISPSMGSISSLYCIPRHSYQESYIYAGTSKGFIFLWVISWFVESKPLLLATSSSLEKKFMSPVLSLGSPVTSSETVISLTKNSHLWIYTRKYKENRKSWWNWFYSKKETTAYTLECVFHLAPVDMNIPTLIQESLSKLFRGELMKDKLLLPYMTNGKDHKIALSKQSITIKQSTQLSYPQLEMSPSTVCFHPQTNEQGDSPAIVVGTVGGEILKINLDYVIDQYNYPTKDPPFIFVEYVQPANADIGLILSSASYSSESKLGNKVYRELLHYHTSRILFLETLDNLVISIDEDHYLAIWVHSANLLTGKCWFEPYVSIKLVMKISSFIAEGVPTNILITTEEITALKSLRTEFKDGKDYIYYGLTQKDSKWFRYTSIKEKGKSIQYFAQAMNLGDEFASIIHMSLSQDRKSLLILLSFKTTDASDRSSKRIVLASFDLKQLKFSETVKLIDFEVNVNSIVKGFFHGPNIQNRSTVFILIDNTFYLYTVEDGYQIDINNKFDGFKGDAQMSFCTSGRVFAHTCTYLKNNQISVYIRAGTDLKPKQDERNENGIFDVFNQPIAVSHNQESILVAQEILGSIINNAEFRILSNHTENIRRERIAEIYGSASNLGVIAPSDWPPQELLLSQVDYKGRHINPKQEIDEVRKLLQMT